MSKSNEPLDPEFESVVRKGLRSEIVPPPTPERVHDRVERIATQALSASGNRGGRWRRPLRAGALATAFAGLALVALIAAGLLWRPWATNHPAASPTEVNVSSPGAISVVGVYPQGAALVYVDGEGLSATEDYGASWSQPRQVPASDSLQDHVWDVGTLDFLDLDHGWMTVISNEGPTTDVVEYRTTDGGLTWQRTTVAVLPAEGPAAQSFVGARQHFRDAMHGRIVLDWLPDESLKQCRTWDTEDGGVTWTGPAIASCLGLIPQVRWVTPTLGVAGSTSSTNEAMAATVSVTRDGGFTWQTSNLPGAWAVPMPELLVEDRPGQLTLVAIDAEYSGIQPLRVFESVDGGAWSTVRHVTIPGGGTTIDDLAASTKDRWVAIVEGAGPECPSGCTGWSRASLFETRDGGQTWSPLAGSTLYGAGGMSWWDDDRGFLLAAPEACAQLNGVNCPDANPTVYITTDGGRSWQPA